MPNILDKKMNHQTLENSTSLDPNNTTQTLDSSLNQTQEPKGGLMANIAEFLPYAPLIFEKFTGQKIPAMTGTMAEIEKSLSQLVVNFQQLSTSLTQVINNQNQIFQRIVNLETSASQQILNLDKRLERSLGDFNKSLESLQSVRLTHEREKKPIEYNPNKNLTTEEY